MRKSASQIWAIASIATSYLATLSPVLAQIVPDNTLPVNSRVLPGCTVCTIDGGTERGSNLFHSFSEFSVPTAGAAFFNNGLQIQNILTRVTGNSVSTIDGLIRANGSANLFLLNPNGIIFGPNARLNLGGSFFASTASAIMFGDGIEFSATNPQAPPLLTINIPLGLQYGSNPGSISVRGSFLQVPNGQTLALGGGNVSLDGAFVSAPGGLVELGAVAGTSTVELKGDGSNLSLSFPQGVALADISLTNGATGFVGAGGGGSIYINAQNLSLAGGSRLLAGIDSGSAGSVAGNIEINVKGALGLTDGSSLSNVVLKGSKGQGGDINITTGQLRIFDGAQVSTSTLGQGDGGNLTVNASQAVQLIGRSADGQFPSGLGALAERGASGKAGDLTINTGTLLVQDGAQVNTSTLGQGDGGSLTVNASQAVQLIGRSADGQFPSGLGALAERGASGKAGDLTINTGTLLVRDGAQVNAGTFGQGDGGNLTVNASQAVQLIGRSADGQLASGLFVSAERGASGKVGDLTINTTTLLVQDGAQVNAGTFGQGDGGDLTVNASQAVQLIGRSADGQLASSLGASANRGASGKAGDLTINTGTLLVRDGAQVNAGTFGQGDGGNLTVNASQAVQLIGTSADGQLPSGLGASANRGASGKAGDLTINTGTLLVRDGAQVSAGTFGAGDGGNLTVNASQEVQLIGTSTDGQVSSGLGASTNPGASGKAGDLTINTDTLLVRDGAQVLVSSPQGQAGNMTIQANSLLLNQGRLSAETAKSDAQGGANITLQGLNFLRLDNESLISANALDQANGGNITIDSIFIVATPATGLQGSDITANAFQGNGGRVNITTQGLFGIEFRPQRTPDNDITVSSEFGIAGEFALNQPDIDPSRGLAELPSNLVDAENQLDRTCSSGGAATRSSFVVTGRGGIPPAPTDPLDSPAIVSQWVTLNSEEQSINNVAPDASPTNSASKAIVEAQGWVQTPDGQVILVAQAPSTTPHNSWLTSPSCQNLTSNSFAN